MGYGTVSSFDHKLRSRDVRRQGPEEGRDLFSVEPDVWHLIDLTGLQHRGIAWADRRGGGLPISRDHADRIRSDAVHRGGILSPEPCGPRLRNDIRLGSAGGRPPHRLAGGMERDRRQHPGHAQPCRHRRALLVSDDRIRQPVRPGGGSGRRRLDRHHHRDLLPGNRAVRPRPAHPVGNRTGHPGCFRRAGPGPGVRPAPCGRDPHARLAVAGSVPHRRL